MHLFAVSLLSEYCQDLNIFSLNKFLRVPYLAYQWKFLMSKNLICAITDYWAGILRNEEDKGYTVRIRRKYKPTEYKCTLIYIVQSTWDIAGVSRHNLCHNCLVSFTNLLVYLLRSRDFIIIFLVS